MSIPTGATGGMQQTYSPRFSEPPGRAGRYHDSKAAPPTPVDSRHGHPRMPPTPRNAVALVAGIGTYRDAGRVPTLRYAARDARALAWVLADPEVCAFPPERVAVLTNRHANRAELVRRLSGWLPAQGQGADLVLIYFA